MVKLLKSRRFLVLFGACLVAGAGLFGLFHLSISRRVDQALVEASEIPGGLEVRIIPGALSSLNDDRGQRLWTHTAKVRDGGYWKNQLFAATEGGLVEIRDKRVIEKVQTSLSSGIADHCMTSFLVQSGKAYVGTCSGYIVVFEGERAKTIEIDKNCHGAVTDLAWHDGALFFSTTSGALVRLTNDKQAKRISPDSETGLTSIAPGSASQKLAVASGSGEIFVLDHEKLNLFAKVKLGAEKLRVTSLVWKDDALVIGTPLGLFHANGQDEPERIRDDLFIRTMVLHRGRLYIGTHDSGVFLFDQDRLEGSPIKQVLVGKEIEKLRAGDFGVWALGPDGASRVDIASVHGQRTIKVGAGGLSSNHISALAFDDRRRLWIGHFDRGVDILDPSGNITPLALRAQQNLGTMSAVNDLLFDEVEGAMFVATSHGVLSVRGTEHRVIDSSDGLIGDAVTAMLGRGDERIFATNQGLSLVRKSGGIPRSIYAFHGLPSNRLYALATSGRDLFVGTLGGLAVIQGLRVEKVFRAEPKGLRANWVSALASAPEGVYVGTVGGGVDLVVADGSVKNLGYRGEKRLTVNPNAMKIIGKKLMVGTLERGLLVYDRDEQRWSDLNGPFGQASATALTFDDRFIYIGTNRGLFRVEKEAFDN